MNGFHILFCRFQQKILQAQYSYYVFDPEKMCYSETECRHGIHLRKRGGDNAKQTIHEERLLFP